MPSNPSAKMPGAPGLDFETWESPEVSRPHILGAPSFPRLSAERVGNRVSRITSKGSAGAPEPVLSLSKDLDSETWESTKVNRSSDR
jgi:hypothetical protein